MSRKRRILGMLLAATVVAACEQNPSGPVSQEGIIKVPEEVSSASYPYPEISEEEYDNLVNTREVVGSTDAVAVSGGSYVEAKMTAYYADIPTPTLPSYNTQSIHAKVGRDAEVPVVYHTTFGTGAVVYPWPWSSSVLNVDLDCSAVQIAGTLDASSSHYASWRFIRYGVGVQLTAQDNTGDYDECQGSGGGGGFPAELTCVQEWLCIDVWNDDTGTWEEIWCGYGSVCS